MTNAACTVPQGQFIYSKYAFEELVSGAPTGSSSAQQHLSLQHLRARLPEGLSGVYRHILDTLTGALSAERPDLLPVLRGRLLPVLVASRDALSVEELVWATRDTPEQVGGVEAYFKQYMWSVYALRYITFAMLD